MYKFKHVDPCRDGLDMSVYRVCIADDLVAGRNPAWYTVSQPQLIGEGVKERQPGVRKGGGGLFLGFTSFCCRSSLLERSWKSAATQTPIATKEDLIPG
jgi:hypothetical protein